MRNVKTVPPSPTYRHLTMSCSTYPTLNAMSLEIVSIVVNSRPGVSFILLSRQGTKWQGLLLVAGPQSPIMVEISQAMFASVDGMLVF